MWVVASLEGEVVAAWASCRAGPSFLVGPSREVPCQAILFDMRRKVDVGGYILEINNNN